MTTSPSVTRAVSETAVRAAFDRRSRRGRDATRPGRDAGARSARTAEPKATPAGGRPLRRWSVAELIAGGTVRPVRPAV